MFTLALDTSASTLSVALLDDDKILSKNTIFESGKQSEFLIPQIEKILKENKIWYQNLSLIAATNGPGSFTGTRIGLAVARTLKLATNLPLLLVNSCEVIAYKYRKTKSEEIFVIIDAKADDLFCAKFLVKNQRIETALEPFLASVEDVIKFSPKQKFLLCGSGKKIAANILSDKKIIFEMDEEEDLIEADLVALLAYEKFCQNQKSSENLNPIYLRAPRISERKK